MKSKTPNPIIETVKIKPQLPKPLVPIDPEAFVTLKKREWRKIRSLAQIRKQAVIDLALLTAGLETATEECSQLIGFNLALKAEGRKIIALFATLQDENKKLKEENTSLKARLPPDPVPEIVGPCRNCPHGEAWHQNPSRLCTRENCPCMAWAPREPKLPGLSSPPSPKNPQ